MTGFIQPVLFRWLSFRLCSTVLVVRAFESGEHTTRHSGENPPIPFEHSTHTCSGLLGRRREDNNCECSSKRCYAACRRRQLIIIIIVTPCDHNQKMCSSFVGARRQQDELTSRRSTCTDSLYTTPSMASAYETTETETATATRSLGVHPPPVVDITRRVSRVAHHRTSSPFCSASPSRKAVGGSEAASSM